MKNNQFHINFKLNGKSFSNADEIIDFSKNISSSVHQFLKDWFSDADFLNVQTSGSTGKPKIIKLKKEFMNNSAIMTGEFFNLKENTSALLCLSTDYIAGKMMLIRAFTLGWQLDVVEPSLNPLENCSKKYDFSAFVPLQLENSLDKINQIKKLIVGGGVVSHSLKDKIRGVKTEIFATYGMTETITHIAVKELNHFNRAEIASTPHYKILPNISITKDNRNCLVINASKLSKESIITNDIVEIISENEFKLLGRIDNVINSGAVKLHPEVIENKLSSVIKNRFFVTGIPDEFLGEKLVLIVEGNSQQIAFDKVNLSKFETPKKTYFLNKFYETETGKIQRKKNIEKLKL